MEKTKILIVDDEPTTLQILEKYLTKEGYIVTTAESALEGAEILKKEFFSIVLTDINMPGISGLDFLLWIKEHSPKSQVIIMTGSGSKEIKEFVNKKGALNYFEKPINLKELGTFLKFSVLNKTFSGNITDLNLFDFIQVISLSGKQKLVSITEPETNQTGYIYLMGGKVIHAEYGEFKGKKAFFRIIKIKNGSFSEISWTEPSSTSINISSSALLLESMKVLGGEINERTKRRILIVDDDPITPLIIEKYLSQQGFEVDTANSALEGAEILKKQFTDLVITDLNMPEVNGFEFLLWIKEHSPKSQVIIITAYGSNAVKQFANQKGALSYFEKPVNLKDLNQFINETFKDKGFSGGISDISLFDFIKMIALSKTRKMISVVDPIANTGGFLYINDERLVHAKFGQIEGEEAFFSIIKMKSGMFYERPWIDPKETIKTNLEVLLLEGAKLIDEETLITKKPETVAEKETSLVRAMPRYLERAIKQKEALKQLREETEYIKYFTIFECGVAFGIVLGNSNKDEVIKIMGKYSKINASSQRENQIFFYDDISLTIIFNENGIAEEMNFGKYYDGKTSLGIGIGDTILKAIQIYGKPKTCTIKGAVWENIAFFSYDTKSISSIRLRNSSFFNYA